MEAGEICVMLGANGAGKSTITKAIIGLVKAKSGAITLLDDQILGLPAHRIHRMGIAWVPQGRQLWNSLTVLDNLLLGTIRLEKHARNSRIEELLTRFPKLGERRSQLCGSLSGGEQQLVAIARALSSNPRLILMDEPTLGLSPRAIADLFQSVREVSDMGIGVLMAEQNARQALGAARRAYLLQNGQVITSGPARELAASEAVQAVYLGGTAG